MGTKTQVDAEKVALAEASYQRCCADPRFLHDFYDSFLKADPRIPPKFANTQFERQIKLLQHALGLLFIYAKRNNPAMLERIAERHNKKNMDITADLYPAFVDSLVRTVEAHDSAYTPEVGEAWRVALKPGIDFMISRYA